MTSGAFQTVPVDSIYVDRDKRQRRDLEKIEELAQSIRENGLINPILITKEHILVAGERRLTAHQHLGFDQITVQYVEELDQTQLHILELEENVQRVDLSWQDHTNAIAAYHAMRAEVEPDWSKSKTATALGITPTHLNRHLLVKKAIDEAVPEVLESPKFTTAYNFVERREERRKTAAKRDLLADIGGGETVPAEPALEGSVEEPDGSPAEPTRPKRHAEIINASFIDWSQTVQTDPYNFIHVDFPYGVSAGNTKGQSAAKSYGGYDDRPEVYQELCEAFVTNLDRFCAPSAHLMFWFSMDYYQSTYDLLKTAGWRVDPFPLIWYKSDNTGILPDSKRGPRRVYETAFFGSRGDRKIVRAVGNTAAAGTPGKGEKIHMSHKAKPMLEHFFRMIVDESTRFLDPTCGSGEAVGVAEALGARYSLGIELNPEYAETARWHLGL